MAQSFEWLQWSLPQKLGDILGRENIRFVGGAVRDSLIGLPINDIDAATLLLPDIVHEKLTAAGISVIPTGLKHGTVTAHQNGLSIEITTLRVDTETDGRHAKVRFTDDWTIDASRRDFTFNALYVDVDGKLFDPFEGVHDLHAGYVRFIGDPAKRIGEDYLRILRFFRFQARYGVSAFDDEGLNACISARNKLATLSVERIREEFLKLSIAKNVLDVIQVMEEHQIIAACYSSADHSSERLQTVLCREDNLSISAHQLARFASILGYQEATGPALTRYFKLSNKDKVLFKNIPDISEALSKNSVEKSQDSTLKMLAYKFGMGALELAVLLTEADLIVAIDDWTMVKNWTAPTFPIKGRDLIEMGFEPGPKISEMMIELEQIWLDAEFKLEKYELLERLEKRS